MLGWGYCFVLAAYSLGCNSWRSKWLAFICIAMCWYAANTGKRILYNYPKRGGKCFFFLYNLKYLCSLNHCHDTVKCRVPFRIALKCVPLNIVTHLTTVYWCALYLVLCMPESMCFQFQWKLYSYLQLIFRIKPLILNERKFLALLILKHKYCLFTFLLLFFSLIQIYINAKSYHIKIFIQKQ